MQISLSFDLAFFLFTVLVPCRAKRLDHQRNNLPLIIGSHWLTTALGGRDIAWRFHGRYKAQIVAALHRVAGAVALQREGLGSGTGAGVSANGP